MNILRTVLGVVVGFVAMSLCASGTTALLRTIDPTVGTDQQSVSLAVLDFTYAILYMGVGAFVATVVARRKAGIAFAVIVFALSLLTAVTGADKQHGPFYVWAGVPLAPTVAYIGVVAATRLGKKNRLMADGTVSEAVR